MGWALLGLVVAMAAAVAGGAALLYGRSVLNAGQFSTVDGSLVLVPATLAIFLAITGFVWALRSLDGRRRAGASLAVSVASLLLSYASYALASLAASS